MIASVSEPSSSPRRTPIRRGVAAVRVVHGSNDLHLRSGLLGVRRPDPARDVTVVVGLGSLERQRLRLFRHLQRHREVLELARADLPAAPGHLRHLLGELVALVGRDRLGQLGPLDRNLPTRDGLRTRPPRSRAGTGPTTLFVLALSCSFGTRTFSTTNAFGCRLLRLDRHVGAGDSRQGQDRRDRSAAHEPLHSFHSVPPHLLVVVLWRVLRPIRRSLRCVSSPRST